jgi:NurA-like 5'-3' nuclease
MNRLNKMIETLVKFNKEGRDNSQTRLLLKLLREADTYKLSDESLEKICRKQSMQSCIDATSEVLTRIEKMRQEACLKTKPVNSFVANSQWQEDI